MADRDGRQGRQRVTTTAIDRTRRMLSLITYLRERPGARANTKKTDCGQRRPQRVTRSGAKRPNAAGLRRAAPINPA